MSADSCPSREYICSRYIFMSAGSSFSDQDPAYMVRGGSHFTIHRKRRVSNNKAYLIARALRVLRGDRIQFITVYWNLNT